MFMIKTYEELTKDELYDIIQLRVNVFIVEQETYYEDLDNHDQQALHLLYRDEKGQLVAYARMLPPGEVFKEASFGRIITTKATRGTGLGKKMMQTIMATIKEQWDNPPVFIQAQDYLTNFYSRFGFVPQSEPYMYECLPHRDMLYTPSQENLDNECFTSSVSGKEEVSKKRERGNSTMAKLKGKGVVVAGLVAGAAAYLSKPENRDKVVDAVNMAKDKVTSFVDTQKDALAPQPEQAETLKEQAKAAADPDDLSIAENKMLSEGAQTTVQYYNEKVEDKEITDNEQAPQDK
ncbi:MAG TPA: GNAT family N-acetyltransferase [Metalysinibacillus jejuensis]|uniref:GNAT family N-acetyltransferase n=1 Tax=Metalysinibacillus jejuensis TaxID=914327 RepID=A0A921T540_9BACL|nr:GNAT family N-acetyltransferase [Metalysinibacillus jejuensis]